MPTHLPSTLKIILVCLSLLLCSTDASAMYNPRFGSFMQRDPLNNTQAGGGYQDGINLYQYQKSQPLTLVDPSGESPIIIGGLAVGAVALCGYAFFEYTHRTYGNTSDKWKHCYTTCKIASYCGGKPAAILGGLAKETRDLLTRSHGFKEAFWDSVANAAGLACADRWFCTCKDCCDQTY
ncbi:RHS repeat-associated core domain-containing protein [Poriferisphaera sp. WC338]|uniref:RHS repeat-associated core domain-containing protein n=1 Tax=Poriferisphaera sp. WC338 TaxID=3425129 RepID=UPI003D818FEA